MNADTDSPKRVTERASTACRLLDRLAPCSAEARPIAGTGPIECPCHRAYRQSRYLRLARLELGLGRAEGARFEAIVAQTRWPRPRTCQLEQAREAELRELLAFRSERRAAKGVPARECQRLSRDDKLELFEIWGREDAP
jgi:hypothetical protein